MNASQIVSIAIFVFLGIFAAVFVIITIRKLKERLRQKMEQLEMQTRVVLKDEWVNCFGFCRGWRCSSKGNGALALTKEGLFFIPVIGDETLVPFEGISEIGTPNSHGGKTNFRKLLSVTFTDDDGKEIKAAWLLKDIDKWQAAIRAAVEAKARSEGKPNPLSNND